MNTAGLNLEQAPPLAVPGLFFALAPLSLVAAGVLLLVDGLPPSPLHPRVMALTHLGTLGLLGSVMLGALYQMVPVVAGARVPAVRLAHPVQVAWVVGVAALVAGLAGHPLAMGVGAAALLLALLLFLVPVALALGRAPGGGDAVAGIRLAVLALGLAAAVGLWLALGHARGVLPPDRLELLTAHVVLAGVGWLCGLIVSVGWVVVPMFYLTASPPRAVTRGCLLAAFASVLGVSGLLLAGASPPLLALAAFPGLLAAWVVVPLTLLGLLKARRRKRLDPSLEAWRGALLLAPGLALLALAALWTAHPRLLLLLGWLVIWGWAGLLVHGMLSRILPFLVWFHRFSSQVGLRPVPPMRRLLPDRLVWIGLAVHLATVLLGALALLLDSDLLLRGAGLGLAATGLMLAVELSTVLRVAARA